jgi:hypothetical protein
VASHSCTLDPSNYLRPNPSFNIGTNGNSVASFLTFCLPLLCVSLLSHFLSSPSLTHSRMSPIHARTITITHHYTHINHHSTLLQTAPPSLLQAAAHPGLRLLLVQARRRRLVQVDELVLLPRQLRVARLVVNLHALHVGRGRLADGTRQLRVPALAQPLAVHHARQAAPAVRRRCIDLRRDLLRRMLLRLRLPRHPCQLSPASPLSPPPALPKKMPDRPRECLPCRCAGGRREESERGRACEEKQQQQRGGAASGRPNGGNPAV